MTFGCKRAGGFVDSGCNAMCDCHETQRIAAPSLSRKIYVAGGMRGLPDHNFPAFNEASNKLRAEGHTVFNPAELPLGLSVNEYLALDLVWICSHADTIALLPGWRNSKGATAEHATAVALGLEIIEL